MPCSCRRASVDGVSSDVDPATLTWGQGELAELLLFCSATYIPSSPGCRLQSLDLSPPRSVPRRVIRVSGYSVSNKLPSPPDFDCSIIHVSLFRCLVVLGLASAPRAGQEPRTATSAPYCTVLCVPADRVRSVDSAGVIAEMSRRGAGRCTGHGARVHGPSFETYRSTCLSSFNLH